MIDGIHLLFEKIYVEYYSVIENSCEQLRFSMVKIFNALFGVWNSQIYKPQD